MEVKYIVLLVLLFGCQEPYPNESAFRAANTEPLILDIGNISTRAFHESLNYLSKDGKTIYFSRSDQEFQTSTLYVAQFAKGKWSTPKRLPFSSTDYNANLYFAPNEKTAFFTSKRHPNTEQLSKEWNIWTIDFNKEGAWGKPKVLPPPINSTHFECCLTMNQNGLAYFSSNRDGSWDIYEAQYSNNTFSNVKKLDNIVNSSKGEWPGYINEAGDVLLFSSIRKEGLGGDDLYITKKIEDTWTRPICLDSTINSASYEDNPRLSQDSQYLLFSSWRDTEFSKGVSNIFYVKQPIID